MTVCKPNPNFFLGNIKFLLSKNELFYPFAKVVKEP